MLESAFDPGGIQAERIAGLWWYMFWTAAFVWVVVVVVAGTAFGRSRRRSDEIASERNERSLARAVAAATALSILILLGTLAYSVTTGRAIGAVPGDAAIRIKVTGHQWWWEFEYQDPVPSRTLVAANEIHVPIGEPIQIIGTSADVIHSFWAPSLFGKKDMIPGKATATWFQVDTPGIYRGQCAEFCGHQHARMAVVIVAEPRVDFERWYAAQLLPAQAPPDSAAALGHDVFMSRGCPLCHTVGGTRALSKVGPPLTHIGSAKTIAAGTLSNTRDNLRQWVRDPHTIKPGVKMPPTDLSDHELDGVVSYLQGLK